MADTHRRRLVLAGVVCSVVLLGVVAVATTPPPPVDPDPATGADDTPTASQPRDGSQPASASPRGDGAPVVRQGRPVDVIDGDTFDLADGTRVRLAIVDTPEVAFGVEPCGPEATDLTGRFLGGETVAIYRPQSAPGTDPNSRLLGEVVRVRDGASLNVALVAAGLGRVDERFTDEDPDLAARLREAAADAPTPDCAAPAAAGPTTSDDVPERETQGSATGDGPVTIVDVRPDGPGDDVQPGDSEYVTLRNGSDEPVDLTGWRIVDAADNDVRIGRGATVAAGGTFHVYSGPGEDAPDRFHAGLDQAYLNNAGGDELRLLDASGATVSTFSYSS